MKAIRWIMMTRAGGFITSAVGESIGRKSNFRLTRRSMNVPFAESISKLKIFGWRDRKGQCKPKWLGAQDEKPYRYRGG